MFQKLTGMLFSVKLCSLRIFLNVDEENYFVIKIATYKLLVVAGHISEVIIHKPGFYFVPKDDVWISASAYSGLKWQVWIDRLI